MGRRDPEGERVRGNCRDDVYEKRINKREKNYHGVSFSICFPYVPPMLPSLVLFLKLVFCL